MGEWSLRLMSIKTLFHQIMKMSFSCSNVFLVERIQLHSSVPDSELSCVHILFVWGWGEELREDVEGVEDLQRGKRGRGAE